MTQKQHRWYLREWGEAFSTHWAGVRGGEVLARPGRPEADPLRDQVVAMAGRLAGKRDGRLSPDTLRHACHVLALGRDIGSMQLTNKQIDQVVAVFRQLAGINLAAMLQTQQASAESQRVTDARQRRKADPSTPAVLPDADRKRLIYALEHIDLPPAYLAELARDAYGTSNWKTLSTEQLHKLRITAGCRAMARQIGGVKRVNVASTL